MHERYQHTGIPFQEVPSMEALLERVGITSFLRFRCGYHIHGQAAVMYEDPRDEPGWKYGHNLCALD